MKLYFEVCALINHLDNMFRNANGFENNINRRCNPFTCTTHFLLATVVDNKINPFFMLTVQKLQELFFYNCFFTLLFIIYIIFLRKKDTVYQPTFTSEWELRYYG